MTTLNTLVLIMYKISLVISISQIYIKDFCAASLGWRCNDESRDSYPRGRYVYGPDFENCVNSESNRWIEVEDGVYQCKFCAIEDDSHCFCGTYARCNPSIVSGTVLLSFGSLIHLCGIFMLLFFRKYDRHINTICFIFGILCVVIGIILFIVDGSQSIDTIIVISSSAFILIVIQLVSFKCYKTKIRNWIIPKLFMWHILCLGLFLIFWEILCMFMCLITCFECVGYHLLKQHWIRIKYIANPINKKLVAPDKKTMLDDFGNHCGDYWLMIWGNIYAVFIWASYIIHGVVFVYVVIISCGRMSGYVAQLFGDPLNEGLLVVSEVEIVETEYDENNDYHSEKSKTVINSIQHNQHDDTDIANLKISNKPNDKYEINDHRCIIKHADQQQKNDNLEMCVKQVTTVSINSDGVEQCAFGDHDIITANNNVRKIIMHSENNTFEFYVDTLANLDAVMYSKLISSIKSYFKFPNGFLLSLYEIVDGSNVSVDDIDDIIDAFQANNDDHNYVLHLYVKNDMIESEIEGLQHVDTMNTLINCVETEGDQTMM